jgi:FKBP-type peptidyl-prolyl cis-trans isomerase FkpA
MKLKFPLIAAFVAMLSLTACGGGGSSSSGSSSPAAESPAQLSYTDTVAGTGATVATGKTLNVNYTGWLYSSTAANNKGTQFQTGNFSFVLGASQVIAGFDQGVVGMKVGGKRTIVIPASLAYGATGNTGIPPNSGVVFDVEVVSMQ